MVGCLVLGVEWCSRQGDRVPGPQEVHCQGHYRVWPYDGKNPFVSFAIAIGLLVLCGSKRRE